MACSSLPSLVHEIEDRGDAFLAAEADDAVRVVILGGAGPLFLVRT